MGLEAYFDIQPVTITFFSPYESIIKGAKRYEYLRNLT